MKTKLMAALFGLLLVTKSYAIPVLGAEIYVAADGDVVATFVGQTASLDNELYLYTPSGPYSSSYIFHNHISTPGDSVNLGFFTAGTHLIFELRVFAGSSPYATFYSGSGALNPDSIPHAVVDTAYAPGVTLVGFEDLLQGGDGDYDDTVFTFTNVEARTGVPDGGSTALLALLSLVALSALRRRA
jgi:hypothetical protein